MGLCEWPKAFAAKSNKAAKITAAAMTNQNVSGDNFMLGW
jgi:hypothetical protein